MLKTLALLILITLPLKAQEITYTLVTSTNTLFWSTTNVPPPTAYALYLTTSGPVNSNPVKRATSLTNSIPCGDLFIGATSGIYAVQITAILSTGIETQRSTNIYLYWVPSPSIVPSGIGGIGVR